MQVRAARALGLLCRPLPAAPGRPPRAGSTMPGCSGTGGLCDARRKGGRGVGGAIHLRGAALAVRSGLLQPVH